MLSRLSRLLPVRLRRAGGRLLCRLPLPQHRRPEEGLGRELVVVASPTPPYFRCLTVYQGRTWAPEPDHPPRAA